MILEGHKRAAGSNFETLIKHVIFIKFGICLWLQIFQTIPQLCWKSQLLGPNFKNNEIFDFWETVTWDLLYHSNLIIHEPFSLAKFWLQSLISYVKHQLWPNCELSTPDTSQITILLSTATFHFTLNQNFQITKYSPGVANKGIIGNGKKSIIFLYHGFPWPL